MTEYQDKDGWGVLFRQAKEHDKQPDYKGHVVHNGVKFQLAGWIRESRNGKTYLSVNIQPPYKPRDEAKDEPKRSRTDEFVDEVQREFPGSKVRYDAADIDDEIPF